MTALTANRNTPDYKSRIVIRVPIDSSAAIYKGSMVCRNAAGDAVPGSNTAGYRLAGVSLGDLRLGYDTADPTLSTDPSTHVDIYRTGVFGFVCSGLTKANVGSPVYLADDQTVQLAPTNVFAGILCDFESATEARVDIGPATQWQGGRMFLIPFTYIGAVGAVGVKAIEDLELPRSYRVLSGFASCLTAPGSGYQCDISITDGTTTFTVVIDDTATKGENKTAESTPFLANTDTDIDLVDDNASGATADVTGYFVCEEA